jgi:hypothetical protein
MHSFFLVMVMKGRHEENPPALPECFFGVFKISHLQHNGQVLNEKNAA